jgi:hypothetical protein
MELPWNICPYCGTPAPGMRREHLTLDEALRPLAGDGEEVESHLTETFEEPEIFPEPESEPEQFEEIANSEEPEN